MPSLNVPHSEGIVVFSQVAVCLRRVSNLSKHSSIWLSFFESFEAKYVLEAKEGEKREREEGGGLSGEKLKG